MAFSDVSSFYEGEDDVLVKLKMMYVNLLVNDALKPLRMVHAQM